jgi:hypothetical protein
MANYILIKEPSEVVRMVRLLATWRCCAPLYAPVEAHARGGSCQAEKRQMRPEPWTARPEDGESRPACRATNNAVRPESRSPQGEP